MCLIIAKPFEVALPKEEYIRNGARYNSDGCGIAYWAEGMKKVKIKKDFKDVDEMLKFIHDNGLNEKYHLVMHFRWATSGWKDEGNRHPYPLVQDQNKIREVEIETDVIMAHNGVITGYYAEKEALKLDNWDKYNDTQKFILEIAGDRVIRNNIHNKAIQELLLKYVGNDRLCFLTKKGDLIVLGDYTIEDGCYFSNGAYKEAKTRNRYNVQQRKNSNRWRGNSIGFYPSNASQPKKNDKKVTEQQPMGPNTIEDSCDACGHTKRLREFIEGKQILYLCKKCRKRMTSGKKKRGGMKLSVIFRQCDNCENFVPEDKLTLLDDGELKACPTCIKEFQETW